MGVDVQGGARPFKWKLVLQSVPPQLQKHSLAPEIVEYLLFIRVVRHP